ncbi:MAG: hypothetical protein V4489_00405 [Chlamydiota bacterium]
MKSIFSKSHYGLASGVALWLSILHFSGEAAEPKPPETTVKALEEYSLKHTVNFSNVSVTEVIRFVSKVTGYNFVFSPDDLGFNVTIVSEEPMSTKNITSALIQTLRVHGLKLLEQEDSFIITQVGSDVNQIPAIVSQDIPGSDSTTSPIITKIFRIKNAKLNTLVHIIKPMTSASSLLDVIQETHQLIVTDITTNVEKITSLLTVLDTPQSNLEIESYLLKNIAADGLISLTEKILAPFLAGNPLLLIPQKETNTVFIVSTPHLIEQAISVMEDLDTPGKTIISGEAALSAYVYKIENQTPENLLSHLNVIDHQIPSGVDPNLDQAIQSAKYIPAAGTIVFITDAHTWDRLKTLLVSIDTVPNSTGKATFWIYKTNGDNPKLLLSALKQLSASIQDKILQDTIGSVRWIQETGSLVFTGPENSIVKLQEIIPTLDLTTPQIEPKVYIYKVLHTSESQMSSVLKQIAPTLADAGFTDAVANMQWVKGSNSLIFKASPEVIKHLEQILPSIDVATPEVQLYVYKIQKAQKGQMTAALGQVADTTQDNSLAAAIHNMQWMADSNTLIFNTSHSTIEKLQSLLHSLDVAKSPQPEMYLYKVHHAAPDKIQTSLDQIKGTLQDKDLVDALNTIHWVSDSHTFIFHGSPDAVLQLKQILPMVDVKNEDAELYTYKVQKASIDQIVNALDLLTKTSKDKEFIKAVQEMQELTDNNTLVFNTNPVVITKLQGLLPSLDIAKAPALHMYKVKAELSAKINATLDQLAKTSEDKDLVNALKNRQWLSDTETFIFHGTDASIAALKQILQTIDVEAPHVELYVYKIHKAPDEEVTAALAKIAKTSQDKELIQAIDALQWVKTSHTLVFNATPAAVSKLKNILPTLDVSTADIYFYPVKEASKEGFTAALQQIAATSKDKELISTINSMQWMTSNKTCIFHGTQNALEELQKLLPSIDISSSSQLFIYKVENTKEADLENALQDASQTLQNKDFTAAVETMQWMPDSHSMIFHTTPSTIAILKNLLPSLDASESAKKDLYLYKIKNASEEQMTSTLQKMANQSQDKGFASAVDTMQWVPESKTFIFNATPSAVTKLQTLLPAIDVSHKKMYIYKAASGAEEKVKAALARISSSSTDKEFTNMLDNLKWVDESKTFVFQGTESSLEELKKVLSTIDAPGLQMYMYTVTSASQDQIATSLGDIAKSSQNKDLIETIDTMQKTGKTFIFHGTPDAILELKHILPTLDSALPQSQLYTYTVLQAPETQIADALGQASQTMQNKEFTAAVKAMRWMPDTHTLVFNTTPSVIAVLQSLLPKFDVMTTPQRQLYLYKIQQAPETQIIAALEQIQDTTQDKELALAIDSVQWIEKSNTLVFNTTPDTLAKLQGLLSSLDITSSPVQLYMYKVKVASEDHMEAGLTKMEDGVQDQKLISALNSRKWVAESHSYIFHGTSGAISELEQLLPMIDIASGPELQLYIYPIKTVPEAQLEASLEQASQTANNKDFTSAIDNMQWMQNSNTLVFNTTPAVIAKLQALLPSLDSSAHPVQMFMYKPKIAKEEQMISSLKQMSQTVQDQDLANVLGNVQWMASSKTFVFHGTKETIAKLEQILPTLDVLQDPTLQLYVYKIQHAAESQIAASLDNTAETLKDKEFSSAIAGMQWVEDSNALVFHTTSGVVAQLQTLLPTLDVEKPIQMYMYKTQNPAPSQLASALQQMAQNIQNKDLADAINSMKWIADTKTFLFHGTAAALAKLEKIIPSLDIQAPKPNELYIYTVQHAPETQIISRLEQMSEKIQNPDFISAVEGVQWIEGSHTLAFNTTPAVIAQLQGLLPTIDILAPKMYMYKVQTASPEQISASLDKMGQTLQDKDLSNAIQSMKWIEESHAFIFNGTPSAISQLQTILPSLDSTATSVLSANSAKAQFLIYNPKNQKGEDLQNTLEELAQNIKGSGLQNSTLTSALDSMKWVPSSNSLVFTGDSASLDKIRGILEGIDIPAAGVFVYKPVYASEYQLQNALTQFAQKLDLHNVSDKQLAQAINEMTWVQDSGSFIFKADPATLAKLKTTLTFLDSAQGLATIKTTHFSLYRLQHVQGDTIIQNLSNLSDTLPPKDPNSASVIKAIQNLQWIKENNSLMITGSPYVVDQIKSFITEFDTASAAVTMNPKGDFYIYKPLHQSPDQLQQSLVNLAKDLGASSFSNADLLNTLQTVRVVPATKSLLFTGTPESLDKVKSFVSGLDTKLPTDTSIQVLGDTTFLIYKIKQAPHDDLIRSLQNFASQLSQSDIADETLAKSISSVNWIQETNSLMFTGPQETLKKVETLVDKFDMGTLLPTQAPRETPATFIVYTPRAQKGGDLINVLHEFMQNLIHSSISDPQLFDTISHLRFIDKTNSLIISGDATSIQKIQELLVKFDIPSLDNRSQVDASNFLIYKLQYHQGIDIHLALKKVAASLAKSSPEANQALIDAIDSLQWLEVTNSLLGTGDPSVLARIKHLVTNLDVPLRQVFIEVLVVETALFNSQNFGLQWGSQLQYLNKTIGAMGNFPSVVTNGTNGSNQLPGTLNLSNPISYATNLNTPVQGNSLNSLTAVPFSTGFDLGVIGDILFHKGQSFISLGSLLNALQIDNDSTVIMNPKIITQDGHTSTIFVGQNIPFVGSFITNSSSNVLTSSNIEYRDVGVNLVITPTLGTSNIITLDISQDISEQSPNTTSIQGSQVTGIQTSHTTMNTRVHVPDRHFLVLSGMIHDAKNHFRTGIPCLGGLPVIGALFAENDRSNTKSNVIIFLRPFIIDSFKDYDLLTADEEALYKDQAGLQDMKEEFDAGTEMIKNLHND